MRRVIALASAKLYIFVLNFWHYYLTVGKLSTMLSIYDFDNYKAFTTSWISIKPNRGRGQFQKIAQYLGVHPTLVSQVFKGPKDLTLEQGALLTRFMRLDEREAEYFVSLLERDRAGENTLRDICQKRINKLKEQAQLIINRVHNTQEIPEEFRVIYYSSWEYAAVRVALSIPRYDNRESLLRLLRVDATRLDDILNFLFRANLVTEENQKLKLGSGSIHLKKDSPLISKHHANWRLRAMNKHPNLSENELAFSSPLSISMKDAEAVKSLLLQTIEEISKTVKSTNPEEMYCINIDWFHTN